MHSHHQTDQLQTKGNTHASDLSKHTTSSSCDKIVYLAFSVRNGGNLDGKDHVQELDQTAVKNKLRAAGYHCSASFAGA